MDELDYNKQQYIGYVVSTEFNQRIMDAYIGLSSQVRPPFVEDMILEMCQMEAMDAMEQVKDDPWKLNMLENEWHYYSKAVWESEEMASLAVLDKIANKQIDVLLEDLMDFLTVNKMFVLVKAYKNDDDYMLNLPTVKVW